MAHDVFISHSSRDKPVADAVCAALEASGIRCWIAPRDIRSGQKWPEAIAHAIEASQIMILIFSADSNSSQDVANELNLAVNSGAAVIPFKIDDVIPKGALRYFLAGAHWLDAMNPPTEKQIKALVQTVKTILGDDQADDPESIAEQYRKARDDQAGPGKELLKNKTMIALLSLALLAAVFGGAGLFAWFSDNFTWHSNREEQTLEENSFEEPLYVEGRGNSVGNISNDGLAAYNDGWIYYSNQLDGGRIYRIRVDGSECTQINNVNSNFINIENDTIYFRNRESGGKLYKVHVDGGEAVLLSEDSSGYINVLDDWIYYTNYHDGYRIYKIQTDGSEKTRLNDNDSEYINVVGGWIYYSNLDHFRYIYRIRLDGSGWEQINSDNSHYINVVDGWAYFTNEHENSKIFRSRIDGSRTEIFNDDSASHLNISGDWIYYINKSDGERIYRTKLYGSEKEMITYVSSASINIIGNWVYYSNKEDNENLYRVRTDGNGNELVPWVDPDKDLTAPEQETESPISSLEELERVFIEADSSIKGKLSENSKSNPAGLNERFVVTKEHYTVGLMAYEIELLEIVSGEEAWLMVKDLHPHNQEPDDGKEYILAKFRFKILKTEKDKPYDLFSTRFKAVSSDGTPYEPNIIYALEPILTRELHEGAELVGYTRHMVDKEDEHATAVYDAGKTGEIWFDLRAK